MIRSPRQAVARESSGVRLRCNTVALPSIVVKGHVIVWDKTQNGNDRAQELIPIMLRAREESTQLTVFVIERRQHVRTGVYSVEG